ncbi:daptide biosynthesis intramembrane metalloprotease [Luteipulveratus mongoliensis]|uniref:daptide biosynthesis intramembrane metalloprotease n=1 Tax=Luteipulveratus mongoliensis TaxID=571913 RepID=UPI0006987B57|nr:daptide biosynthesis intramembrane metalloprotease [Luteipulveratus mongoliensis]
MTTYAPMPTTVAVGPQLCDDVTVHPPIAENSSWTIQRGPTDYLRTTSWMAQAASLMDGSRDLDALIRDLGDPWTRDRVVGAVAELGRQGCLVGTSQRKPQRVLSVRRPFTIQLTLLDPSAIIRVIRPVVRLLAHRSVRALSALLVVAGLLTMLVGHRIVGDTVTRPLSIWTYLAAFLAFSTSSVVHELAHGATLSRYGGKSSRIGVMIFYLTPAFFCDISDSWRLPENRQRVHVALVGIYAQLVIGGIAALGIPFTNGDVRDTLVILCIATYIAAALNVLPFVKFDGYIALMTHLDEPHLRRRAMHDARGAVGHVLFGGTYERSLVRHRWATAYGIACIVFPAVLVTQAVRTLGGVLAALGTSGIVLGGCVLVGLAVWVLNGLRRIARVARTGGASRARIVLVTGVLVGAAACVLGLVRVPTTVSASWTTTEHGTVLVASDNRNDTFAEGTPVTLYRTGMFARVTVGHATVGPAETVRMRVPMSALAPVRAGLKVPVKTRPVHVDDGPRRDATSGTAVMKGPDAPLWKGIAMKYFGWRI